MAVSQPLRGIRVADFSQLFQGPLATQVLAELGADVVKVEPLRGDLFRSWSLGDAYAGGESLSFLSVNRGKRSIAVDLKSSAGLEVVNRLLDRADVVIENFRPGVMERLGIGYATVAQRNPRIVYCSSSGFGSSGPYVERPGQDLLVQALAGTMWLNGRRDDPPTAIGFGVADAASGLHIIHGVLAALFERERTGRGQLVEVNLLSSLMALQIQEFSYFLNTGHAPSRPVSNGTAAYSGAPLGVYRTADGHLAIAMTPIARLARLIGAETLYDEQGDNNVERRDQIHRQLEERFVLRPTDEWLGVLLEAGVWCAPVQSFAELKDDPQVAWNKSIVSTEHPTAGRLLGVAGAVSFGGDRERPPSVAPPRLGEHTREVLAELGLNGERIDALIAEGAFLAAEVR